MHELRPHPGQQRTAANLRGLLVGSKIMTSHEDCEKVQDAYSMRCAPQVHGAAKDAWRFADPDLTPVTTGQLITMADAGVAELVVTSRPPGAAQTFGGAANGEPALGGFAGGGHGP